MSSDIPMVWPKPRPMSSAPKDGTAIFGFFPPGAYVARTDVKVIHWSGWGGGVWETQGGGRDSEPVGWLPLPPVFTGRYEYSHEAQKTVWLFD